MTKPVTDFKGFGKGDIATLSDIQTQKEYKALNADFKIIEVRTYREPNDFFNYTGYICEYKADKDSEDEPQQIMILLREMGDDYDLLVFYMDQDGDVTEYDWLIEEKEEEGDESGDEEDDGEFDDEIFDDDDEENDEEDDEADEDLVERFEVTMHFDGEDEDDRDVTWDKKDAGSTFGVQTHSTESGDDEKTLAEYFTNDNPENPHAFIEWTGDSEKGWIEIWYGCEIRPEDIEMFPYKKI